MRTILLIVTLLAASTAAAQNESDLDELRSGKGFIATEIHTAEEDQKLLDLFEGLRVADVSDGMDAVGLAGKGLMDPAIHPLWKDAVTYRHRFVGIAVTARYVPTNLPSAGRRDVAKCYTKAASMPRR